MDLTGRKKLKVLNNTHRYYIILWTIILIFSETGLFSQENNAVISDSPIFRLDEETPLEATDENAGNLIPLWEFVRMFLILGGVIGVIYLFFFFLKRGVRKKMPESQLLKVIASMVLQGNNIVYLIQIVNKVYLVGSGGNNLSLISEITDKETLDTIRLNAAETTASDRQSFSNILLKLFKPDKNSSEQTLNPISFIKRQQDRLKKLK